jgi:hypothetical protein
MRLSFQTFPLPSSSAFTLDLRILPSLCPIQLYADTHPSSSTIRARLILAVLCAKYTLQGTGDELRTAN